MFVYRKFYISLSLGYRGFVRDKAELSYKLSQLMKFYEGSVLYESSRKMSLNEINIMTINASKINKEIENA